MIDCHPTHNLWQKMGAAYLTDQAQLKAAESRSGKVYSGRRASGAEKPNGSHVRPAMASQTALAEWTDSDVMPVAEV
jgi:hypothetical protein